MKAVRVYAKNILLRLSIMKGEVEIQAPTSDKTDHALAFFLRLVAVGSFVWLITPLIAAVRWW